MVEVEILDELLGKVLVAVDVNDDKTEMEMRASDGSVFRLYHEQDCCESVSLEEVIGDLGDILHLPIALAEVVTSDEGSKPDDFESQTWTFYKLATAKGRVTLRWLGISNGYYSEAVTFARVKPAAQTS